MNVNMVYVPRPECRARVIALHCSGAGAGQWRYLAEALGGGYEVTAPELYGSEGAGPWTGEHAFTLADEAAKVIALVDATDDRTHLVGHSYGGGVALNVALARPERIASMVLYEPSAFHLLRQLGETGRAALAEIASVARRMCDGVVTGDYRGAAATFVDYWNGGGAWDAMRTSAQSALMRWAPKGPLDFRALIADPTPTDAYRGLRFPVLVLRGEYAPTPTRLIADALRALMPTSRSTVVGGAGHMGPLTHGPEVTALIVRHIEGTDAQLQPSWHPHPSAAAPRPAEAVS